MVHSVSFKLSSEYQPADLTQKKWGWKILGSQPWPFGITWRHQSRDHWTRNMRFPISSQFEPAIHLTRFWDIKLQRYRAHDLDLSGSRDVIGHVTIGLAMCGFLLVVNMNRWCISHGCWNIELERFWGHLDLLGTRDVICQVTTGLTICVFPYSWSIWTDRLSRTVYETLSLKYIGDSKTDFTSSGQRVSLSFRT